MNLSVSEVFYSIQGEGITSGYPAVFLRLGGCNLMCGGMGTQFDNELHNGATWRCDTIEVWMNAKNKKYDEILPLDCISALSNGAHLIITGGEPTLQQKNIQGFIEYLKLTFHNLYIEIETNGTIMPNQFLIDNINQWNCSPKLSNSGHDINVIFIEPVIKKLNELNTMFKFVITNQSDWDEINKTYFSIIDKNKIWLMPSGENQELLNESKQTVAEICKQNYLKFTNRLHIEIWDKKTGV